MTENAIFQTMSSGIQIIFAAITSFVITFFAVPSIIKVAQIKSLFDQPNKRKSHDSSVPTLGGIAIFAGFIFSITFWSNQYQIMELQYIISALIIMFFIGIKDDIVNLVAIKKLFAQVVAATIIVVSADIRLTSFYGIFGVYDIPYFLSVILSLLVIIFITNSMNLVDGIDTLAASVGSICMIVFGTWFFLVSNYHYAILSFSMLGSLIAFLYYNKTPARIFMGDTGSQVLGIVCAILAIRFIEFSRIYYGPSEFKLVSAPTLAISVLIVPIYDTLQVFIRRILDRKSPFNPDRKHIHHSLIDLGLTHIQATLFLVLLSSLIIYLNFMFQRITAEILLFINLTFMFTLFSFFDLYNKKRVRAQLTTTNHQ